MDVSLGHRERKKEFLIPMAIARMRIPKAIKSRRYKLRVTGVRERGAVYEFAYTIRHCI